jgi:hypothetical protein
VIVTPLPGTSPDNLRAVLGDAALSARNLRGRGGTAQELLSAYLVWAAETAARLATVVRGADVTRLILTPGHDRLLMCAGWERSVDRVVNSLLRLELDWRIRELQSAADEVARIIDGWALAGVLVVLDTGFYINVPKPVADKSFDLRDVDFAHLLNERLEIRVIIPMAVLDELDGLKQRGASGHARCRAGHALGVFDEIFRHGQQQTGTLQRADFGDLISGVGQGLPRSM